MKKSYLLLLILPVVFLSACTINKNAGQNGDIVPVVSEPNHPTNKSIVSDQLGIKVNFYSSSTNEISAVEEGNKIYFFNKFYEDDYKNGQSLEVFTKDKDTKFEDAIESMFLKEEKYKDSCFVYTLEDTTEYRKAIIDFKNSAKFPENTECINGDPSPSCDSCPEHYSKTNASLYFIYFKENPDKFFYLTLGQASLIGDYDYFWYGNGDNREWFNNIEFTE